MENEVEQRKQIRLVLAGVAMHGLLSGNDPGTPDGIAILAFRYADSLLAAEEMTEGAPSDAA